MKLYYCLEAIDDIIISQSPATADIHQSLDYIPGSTILGAIAAQSYAELKDSWGIFHANKVKFSNAYIASYNTKISQCLPTPLSWHVPKGESLYTKGHLNPNIKNHAHDNYVRNDEIQEEQCRSDYINTNQNQCRVQLSSSTKTAINAETGTVEESKLYTYNYIQANQKFIGWIEADKDTIQELRSYLENITRIGKSRNTEFGHVRTTIIGNEDQNTHGSNIADVSEGKSLTIWLTSDCQMVNGLGFPVVAPTIKQLGLGLGLDLDTKLDLNHSFINTHSNVLFNRKRQRFDSEKVLINKGSVLVYKVNDNIKADELKNLQIKGIGINQQLGFGNIVINPQWSNSDSITEDSLFSTQQFDYKKPHIINTNAVDSSILCTWINNKLDTKAHGQKTNENVNNALSKICNFYRNGRAYKNIDNSYEAGPTKTQWGLLYNLIRYSNQEIDVSNEKFLEIIKIQSTDSNDWDLEWDNNGIKTFSNQFKFVFKKISNNTEKIQLLERLNQYKLETNKGLKQLEDTLKTTEKDHE